MPGRWGLCLYLVPRLPPASPAKFPSAAPRMVKFTSGVSAVVAEEGGEATFQCIVSPSDAVVSWFRDGALLQPSEKFLISKSGASHSLTVCSLTLEDSGQITVEAEGVLSSAALRVRGVCVCSVFVWQGGPPQGLVSWQHSMPACVQLVWVTWRLLWVGPRCQVPTLKEAKETPTKCIWLGSGQRLKLSREASWRRHPKPKPPGEQSGGSGIGSWCRQRPEVVMG